MPAERSTHVLVVGIDGVRFDSLQEAETPNLDLIAAAGFLTPIQVAGANPTISAPVWSSVATGVDADQHGVLDNSGRPAALDRFDDFAAVLQRARPGSTALIAASWHPLVRSSGNGPLFSSGGWASPTDPDASGSVADAYAADAEVAEYAAQRLRAEPVDLAFVYFGVPDVVCHDVGTGVDYQRAIESSDARLGQLLDAVAARPNRSREAWTVFVVTDHGHLADGGHGGDSAEERTAWLAASGPGLNGPARELSHADIPVQVLASFGVAHPAASGRVFDAV